MINFEEYSRYKTGESLKEGLREQWIHRELRQNHSGRRQSGWLKNLAGLFSVPKMLHTLRGVEQPVIPNECGCR